MIDEPNLTQKIALSRLEEAEIEDAQLRNSIEEDLKQFKRLRAAYPDLSDSELAHRLVISPKQLKVIKKYLGD